MKNIIYTDGSVTPQVTHDGLHPGGYAYRILHGAAVFTEGSGQAWTTGINRMELAAVHAALSVCPVGSDTEVHTDSMNTLNWLTGLWTPKHPGVTADVQAIRNVIKDRRLSVAFVKVAAHTGVTHNEWCDQAARAAMGQLLTGDVTLPSVTAEPAAPVPAPGAAVPIPVNAVDSAAPFTVHVTNRGGTWTAQAGERTFSGEADDQTSAVCQGILEALKLAPVGSRVTVTSPSVNHVNWLSGAFRAKAPRVQQWLADVRAVAQARQLIL